MTAKAAIMPSNRAIAALARPKAEENRLRPIATPDYLTPRPGQVLGSGGKASERWYCLCSTEEDDWQEIRVNPRAGRRSSQPHGPEPDDARVIF